MPTPRRTRRTLARLAALVAALVAGTTLSAPAGAAQTYPWGTSPAGSGFASGPAQGIVLVGDSLIASIWNIGIGEQAMADHLRAATGRSAYVNAASGASWVTYGWPGQQNGNSLVKDYATLFQPAVVVGALGSNDGSLIHFHSGVYSPGQQYSIMATAVDLTLDNADCVLLVNTRTNSGNPQFPATAMAAVNANMTWLDATVPGVHVADWNTHATGHPTWFTDGIHMTLAGKLSYAAFISDRVEDLLAAGC
jgi:hypothetical protein